MHEQRKPYHFMETAIRITTAATVDHRLGVKNLNDLLRITEDVAGDARHMANELTIWLGDQEDPASVVVVCDRLIEALRAIRDHNAPPVAGPELPDTTGYGRLGAAWAQQAKEGARERVTDPEPYAVNSGLEHDTPGTGLVPLPEDAICEDPDLGTWAPGELVEAYGS